MDKQVKKRGRPSKKKTELVEELPKKRGRRPKDKKEEQKLPKKRGRKPKEQVVIQNVQKNVQTEEQIILHIPIKTKDSIDFNIDNLNNDQKLIPKPYDDSTHFVIKDSVNLLEKDLQTEPAILNDNPQNTSNENLYDNPDILKKYNYLCSVYKNNYEDVMLERNKILPIFLEYNVYNKKNEWPSSINIDCLWCCHSFDNFPFGIPIKKTDEKVYMFGNFCSPECAAAYNFESNFLTNDIWERYSLLNYLYKKNNKGIKLAPPKLLLKKFGGRMNIQEFRKNNNIYDKNYKLILPPMVSIIPFVEDVCLTTNEDTSQFNSMFNSQIQRVNREYKLKRNKPLPNSQNTLENCMNLKYL